MILYDNMPGSALDKVVPFAGEVLFERTPISMKPESTLGAGTDWHMSGQPEVPHTKDEKAEKTYLISSVSKQVLNSRNKSKLIVDVIQKYAQKKTEKVEFYLVLSKSGPNHDA